MFFYNWKSSRGRAPKEYTFYQYQSVNLWKKIRFLDYFDIKKPISLMKISNMDY